MDGNNRWSKKNSCTKYLAYKKGANNLIKLSNYIFKNTKTAYISAFALSINNLNRSPSVLKMIENVLTETLKENKNRVLSYDIHFLGNFEFLHHETQKIIFKLNQKNEYSKKLYIFLNYGGREDIEKAAFSFKSKNKDLKSHLISKNLPDPDILIRTGGYNRLSNFLLYQMAFTELFFLKKLWPDLNHSDLKKIFEKYFVIERKFGR